MLGHELMHVYNRDILTSSVAAAIAGVISSVANLLFFFGGSDRDRNPLLALATMIVAPVAATVIQLAISRTREYDADQDGARLTGIRWRWLRRCGNLRPARRGLRCRRPKILLMCRT